MYQLLKEVTRLDARPGDLVPPQAFRDAGCDLPWLVRSGAVRPVDPLRPPRDGDPDPDELVADLHARLTAAEDELAAERGRHRETLARSDGGAAARIVELEGEVAGWQDRHAAEQLAHEQTRAELAVARQAAPLPDEPAAVTAATATEATAAGEAVTVPVPEQPASVPLAAVTVEPAGGRKRGR